MPPARAWLDRTSPDRACSLRTGANVGNGAGREEFGRMRSVIGASSAAHSIPAADYERVPG